MRQTGKMWVNQAGQEVPVSYVSKHTQFDDKVAHLLCKEALILHKRLLIFKGKAFRLVLDSYNKKIEEHGINGGEPRGNHTIYSFDQSVKITLKIAEGIIFDETLMDEAHRRFQHFVSANLTDNQAAIGKIILAAFDKRDGAFDPKRVLSLNRFRAEIKDAEFQRALELIDSATQSADSKRYLQIFRRDEHGEYIAIQLNFSSI